MARYTSFDSLMDDLRSQPSFMPSSMIFADNRITVYAEVRDYMSSTPTVEFVLTIRETGEQHRESTLTDALKHWF